MILLLKLFLAHLIGDFVLQFKSELNDKAVKQWKSPFLYLHAGSHFLLILLLTWDISYWKLAGIIAIAHLIVDGLKLQFQRKFNQRLLFFADQALHLVILIVVWCVFTELEFLAEIGWKSYYWYVVTGAIFLTRPSTFIISNWMDKWAEEIEDRNADSLTDAGKYIGILERLFVFVFMVLGHWQPIGFLIAAKSVFRFGDLTRAKDRKLTEYIVIGTLLSFGLAIVTGSLVNTGLS